ncbi:MAG TPA: acyl-CoA dehydrogenase family protein [Candidatus Kapabacteria bacterium]
MDFTFTPDELHWQSRAREFAHDVVTPLAREMDESCFMPHALIEAMAERGFLGGMIPKPYGGSGMDALSLALVYEELGRACSSVRGFMTVHTSLVMQCIHQWGTPDQKSRLLPAMARGELIGCYALTEPEAGSDAASIQTTATKSEDGYTLNGEKIWITNGNIARLAIVFAKLDTLKEKKPHEQITAFFVPLNAGESPGIKRTHMPGESLGHRASDHAHIVFNDCYISSEMVLGGEGMGFKVAMSALDHGRLGVAAGALGVHQACLDACVQFAKERKQFGKPIGDFEMIQSTLAEMKASLDASRLLVYRAAWAKEALEPPPNPRLEKAGEINSRLEKAGEINARLEKAEEINARVATAGEIKLSTSIAKYFATNAACKAASDAVLLHGARGYSNEYPVERYYRDIKGLQIYEGTEHIQKIVIARELLKEPGLRG